jgi:hypothetical protein
MCSSDAADQESGAQRRTRRLTSVTNVKYKGFRILARPYQLYESKRWAVDLQISARGRRR